MGAVLFWSLASPKPNSTVGKKENGTIRPTRTFHNIRG